jgi:voltage-gated potassium channel
MNPKSSIKKITQHFGVWRYSAGQLLASLILLFAATPLIEDLPNGAVVESVMLSLVLISAGLAVSGKRKVLEHAMLLLVPTVIANWTRHWFPSLVPPDTHLVLGMMFTGYVVANILRFILRATRVNSEVLCAAISVYLLIGLLWTFAYMLLAHLSPNAFAVHTDAHYSRTMTNFNAFYFSFTTLSTIGFGDITPMSRVARTLACMESITGMFYVAILISRLVSLYAPASAATADSDPTP